MRNANCEVRNRLAAPVCHKGLAHAHRPDLIPRSAFHILFPFASSLGLVERYCSVRGYGSQTYKPRQGRNAATVVCFALP